MNENLSIFYLGFSLFPGIGSVKLGKLIDKFGSVKKAWKGSKKVLKEVLGEKAAEEFVDFRKNADLEKELEGLRKKDIKIISWEDKEYPERVKIIKETNVRYVPFLIYIKGDVEVLSSPKTIAIVGTRKITSYGRSVTEMLTGEIVANGFVTVSGLALGVDATAHKATISNGGKTIAVLGTGVDLCTPRENQKIYDDILTTGGTIISTFPPGMQANVGTFPARNALIAGLSLAVLVTEGATDSGSLITANYAKKFDRSLFAVPGPITSNLSKGSNSLIKNGATPVTSSADILDKLGIIAGRKFQTPNFKKQIAETKEEQEILDLLQTSPLHFDEIVRRIKKDSKNIGSLLSLMELKGMIKSDSSIYALSS